MRTVAALLIAATALLAQEKSIADRFPSGATAYAQLNGFAGKVDAFLESDLGTAIRQHDAVQAFLKSPQGLRLTFGQAVLMGTTGQDLLGNLRTLASREIAIAVYGAPQRYVAMARVDAGKIEDLLTGLEMLGSFEREEILAAEEGRPALWRFKNAFVMLEGDWLTLSGDRLLIWSVRNGTVSGLASDALYRDARNCIPTGAVAFAYLDLEPFRAKLQSGELPKDLGEAFIQGALPHRLRDAPWAAFGIEVHEAGGDWSFDAISVIPPDADDSADSDAVTGSFGGNLGDLPFTLSDQTLGVLRMRRDLRSIWSHRDALIAERGIPGLVEFETNFGNLTAGMSWTDEFLPNLGEEFILIAMRPDWPEGEASPALRLPAGAILWPLKDPAKMERSLRVTFYNTIGIVNASQQGMMEGVSLLPMAENYKGVRIETARYAPPDEETGRSLHVRYNLAPSLAVVDGYLVLASSDSIIRMLIDGRGGKTSSGRTSNVAFRIEPEIARTMLQENREQLIAQTMLRQGDDRKTAERKIDAALDLARCVDELRFDVEESSTRYGARLRFSLRRPGEG